MTDDELISRQRTLRKLGRDRPPRKPSVLKPWPAGQPRDRRGEHLARVAAEVVRLRGQGLKQYAIAARLCISQATVSRVLTGRLAVNREANP